MCRRVQEADKPTDSCTRQQSCNERQGPPRHGTGRSSGVPVAASGCRRPHPRVSFRCTAQRLQGTHTKCGHELPKTDATMRSKPTRTAADRQAGMQAQERAEGRQKAPYSVRETFALCQHNKLGTILSQEVVQRRHNGVKHTPTAIKSTTIGHVQHREKRSFKQKETTPDVNIDCRVSLGNALYSHTLAQESLETRTKTSTSQKRRNSKF